MRLLVLGGTAWLGSSIAACAVARGDDVTCLARGESGAAPAGVRFVRADRDDAAAYDEVASTEWDAVVDVSRQPGHVRRAVEVLADMSGFFAFVSSGNVYADHSQPGQDEAATLLPALDADVMDSMETYGEAKVACEQHVLRGFRRERAAIVRAGLIGGPGDVLGRTGYWPLRFARPAAPDATVLVPDAPDLLTQVIDVRDLSRWIVELASRRCGGVFNAVGETLPLPEHLDVARTVAGHCGPVVRVDSEWLLSHGVAPWMGDRSLPLWLPDPAYAGFSARSNAAARAAGLATRSLEATLADTLDWELAQGLERVRHAGLAPDDERTLLAALKAG